MSEQLETGSGAAALTGTPGARLRQARERRGLAITDIANHLKLAPAKVEAMEAGQWEKLLPLPYLRGFVRSYAKLVQIDAVTLLAEIDVALGRDVAAPLPSLQPGPDLNARFAERGRSHLPDWALSPRALTALIGLVLMIVLVAWLVSAVEHPVDELPSPVASPAPVVPVTPPADGRIEQVLPAPGTDLAGQAVRALPAPPAVVPPGSATAVVPGPSVPVPAGASLATPQGSAQGLPQGPGSGVAAVRQDAPAVAALTLRFADQSWVEVRDASGKLLYSGLNRAGTEQTLRATGPFDLVIGNPAAVTLLRSGASVDLSPHTRQNVARLRLP